MCMFYRLLFVLLYFFFRPLCCLFFDLRIVITPLYLQILLEAITWLTVVDYLCHKWPWICPTCRNHFPVLSSFMTYHQVCTYSNTSAISGAGTAYPSGASEPPSLPVFSGVCVTRSIVLYVCFVDRCLSFCTFSSGHCVVCSSSTYGLWLPLWVSSNSSWTTQFLVAVVTLWAHYDI